METQTPDVILIDKTSFNEDVLYEYFGNEKSHVGNYILSQNNKNTIIDLSQIEYWDLTSLLWLVVAIKHYFKIIKKHNKEISLLLKLPAPSENHDNKKNNALKRSGDFLRRWKFDLALSNLVEDISTLLIPNQSNYFNEPLIYYKPKHVSDETGFIDTIVSTNLVEIKNLGRNGKISSDLVDDHRRRFSAARMGDILHKRCNIKKYTANQFTNLLLVEGMLNIKEHPNASLGMISIHIDKKNSELVLVMVDDGDPIQQTIFPHYKEFIKQNRPSDLELIEKCNGNVFKLENNFKSEILDFATERGVSRKVSYKDILKQRYGMGLYYLRHGTTSKRKFGGSFRITSGGISSRYSPYDPDVKSKQYSSNTHLSKFDWKGNLLRVSIPVKLHVNKK